MLTVGLYTLGCKVSQYETEAISEAFERAGCLVRPFSDKNDIYVINTCTVTAESDRKSRQFIRRAIKENPEAVIAVVGCYSQRSPDEVAKIEGVSAVLGTADKMKCVEIAQRMLSAKCRVQSAECKVQSAECRVQSADCRVQNAELASPFRRGGGEADGEVDCADRISLFHKSIYSVSS